MRFLFLITFALAMPLAMLAAPATAKTEQLTVFIKEAECPACAYSVMNKLLETEGVKQVDEGVASEVWVKVTYDPGKVGLPLLNRAVWKAYPLHGNPYRAYLKLQVPEYGQGDNARFVDQAITRWKERLSAKLIDREKGMFEVQFPVPKTNEDAIRNSWQPAAFLKAIHAARADGPRLRASFVVGD